MDGWSLDPNRSFEIEVSLFLILIPTLGAGPTEDEKDTASRIEDKANEKANGNGNGNGNGARRRSRSRSRSRPPTLETLEENYSKEYQE